MRPAARLEVAVVADFSVPARAALFEARILFFLGSWIEHAGAAGAFPLRLVCVGSVPRGVRVLAKDCGAAIFQADIPVLKGAGNMNKILGLDGCGSAARTLLLDADVLVLGDFTALAAECPDGIAAAPAGLNSIPETFWRAIYAHLRRPYPDEVGPTLFMELGLVRDNAAVQRRHGTTSDLRRMPPYHNTGVVLAPRNCGLAERWSEDHASITELFASPDYILPRDRGVRSRLASGLERLWRLAGGRGRKAPHTVTGCDQAAFATAVESLRGEGMPFRRLPPAYHGRLIQCAAGVLSWGSIKLFHAAGFLRSWSGNSADLAYAVGDYARICEAALAEGAKRRGDPELPGNLACAPRRELEHLLETYVLPHLGA